MAREAVTKRDTPGTEDRHPLSRRLILSTAIELMDAEGAQGLTMRRLGEALGVEAMSLYHHVNGREDLLEGVVDQLVDQIRVAPESTQPPHSGWQSVMQLLAHEVRQLALAHPKIFPLIATRHPAAPWLRPPLRSLRVVEEFLRALTARGLTDVQAARAYRSFTSFLLGHLLLEAATSGAETSPVEEPLDEGGADISNGAAQLPIERFPTVLRMQTLLSEDRTKIEFEDALESLLNRLDLELSQ
ncbi:TetR family transcriptional regulator [Phycicoccus sp. Root563]|uniref:TetR/AcrR family transcriptional regulator n=1 Tax=Phycicoccus sp. Root563 TaxID=1736562 RepID=UPI000703001B|nr:TetR/AcrR family transcriptional regulator C-terminal domain-containing protein [Phycicoccus sp. Root563]KQZ87683.1 TetR family transcriptional regulator [Phycicoccus sp. Root563]